MNFSPVVSPLRPKSEKSIMHWTIVSQVDKMAGDGDQHVEIYQYASPDDWCTWFTYFFVRNDRVYDSSRCFLFVDVVAT